jgi:signal transduction histidine kinase
MLADQGRLGQLLDNLISNALKFTPPQGRVTVRVGQIGESVLFEVADTGIGIDAADQERLFERFFRTQAASENAIPGTGLGLSISQAIAEAHGGQISVRSEVGVGTTFRVDLPLRLTDAEPVAAATPALNAA